MERVASYLCVDYKHVCMLQAFTNVLDGVPTAIASSLLPGRLRNIPVCMIQLRLVLSIYDVLVL